MDDTAFKAQISCVGITEGFWWYFLHAEIFVDMEYKSQLFRVQLRPRDNPIVQLISGPYRWMTLLSKLRFLVLGLLKDCDGIFFMRFVLMWSTSPNYLGASFVLVTTPLSR